MTFTANPGQAKQEPGCQAETGLFCARKHWSVYWLIIALTLVTLSARVMHVQNHNSRGATPFFSANDRSRWCTVHALVDYGTYEIDRVIQKEADIHWDTIDKVRHVGRDGHFHYYSSKPPFLSTFLAGQYWLLQRVTGWHIDQQTLWVVRCLLWLNFVLPFCVMLWSLARVLDRVIVADWTRYFVLTAAACGTYLSTFAITLNNHLPAAVVTMLTIDAVDLILRGRGRRRTFVALGLWASLAFAFELPALSLLAAVSGIAVWSHWRWTLVYFLPPVVAVLLAAMGTNYWAHGEWALAYSHRNDGPPLATVSGDFDEALNAGEMPSAIAQAILNSARAGVMQSMQSAYVEQGSWMGVSPEQQRWVVRDRIATGQFAILKTQNSEYTIRDWNNWYDFPGSYWAANNPKRSTVDRGTAEPEKYLFHCLFGHHGIFSLTPIWILAAAGLVVAVSDRWLGLRVLSALAILLTVVVICFYANQPEHDRNYGGQTSALRWTFWLIPFWLLGLIPLVQRFAAKPWQRLVLLLVLVISALSAAYSWPNPWVHPWLSEIWPSWLFPA